MHHFGKKTHFMILLKQQLKNLLIKYLLYIIPILLKELCVVMSSAGGTPLEQVWLRNQRFASYGPGHLRGGAINWPQMLTTEKITDYGCLKWENISKASISERNKYILTKWNQITMTYKQDKKNLNANMRVASPFLHIHAFGQSEIMKIINGSFLYASQYNLIGFFHFSISHVSSMPGCIQNPFI